MQGEDDVHSIRVYVDTSVFGGARDEAFAESSLRFFERVRNGEFAALISQVSLDELATAPKAVRTVLSDLPAQQVQRIAITDEVRALADAYVAAGAVGEANVDDALHVAAATVAHADVIVSWNFRHIVNFQRIRRFNGVNLGSGYAMLDIRSPLEMEYGDQDEEI